MASIFSKSVEKKKLDVSSLELSKYFMLVHHPDLCDNRVLLYKDNSCLEVPCYISTIAFDPVRDSSSWISDFLKQSGMPFEVSFLRRIWHQQTFFRFGYTARSLIVLESWGEDWSIPSGAEWVELTAVSIPDEISNAREPFDLFRREYASGVSRQRPIFQKRGWLQCTVLPWVREHIGGEVSHVELISARYTGAAIRMRVGARRLFVKVNSNAANEAAVYSALESVYPSIVVAPMAIDVKRRFVLMSDCGEPRNYYRDRCFCTTDGRRYLDIWLSELAAMHRGTALCKVKLKSAGLHVIGVEALSSHFDSALRLMLARGLLQLSEATKIATIANEVNCDAQEVIALKIPNTLVHGDLESGNVCPPQGNRTTHVLIDWAESCISHPFFDESLQAGVPAYLDHWLDLIQLEDESLNDARKRLLTCYRRTKRLKPLMLVAHVLLNAPNMDDSYLSQYAPFIHSGLIVLYNRYRPPRSEEAIKRNQRQYVQAQLHQKRVEAVHVPTDYSSS